MNNNQKRNLDAVSGIDDDIIEKQTKKRVSLLQGGGRRSPSKKKWYIMGGSMAAALLLILGTVLLLVNLLAKQVPVYTGMTVSNDAPTATVSTGSFTVLELNANGDNGNHNGHYKGDYKHDHGDLSDPFEKPIEDSLVVVGAAEERYYAKANEDIYITVHIDNPDSFEIMSFTLNGEKYSSYMFEAGSDMENLILKVNVGATEGVQEYTIDAIKYVDGTEIKDVRMEGDQTVEVGVYTDKQPAVTVSGVTVDFYSVSFTVSGTDEMGLIADSNGKVEAVLYDGDTIVATKELSLTDSATVTFDGLSPNTLYEYAVVATYDALDGKGYSSYILTKQAFYTEAPLLFDGIVLTSTGISFDFIKHESADGAAIESIALSDGTTTQNLGANATSKDGLLPATTYTLTATYRNGDRTEEIALEFTTAPLTYTVIHRLEKVDGTYETVATVTEVVALGETVTAEVQTHTGFTSPTAQSVTGALGDPLTVTYQYPRTEYLVTLVCNDGTTPMESLKYGTDLPHATREGFAFGGWFTDAECTNPITTVPAEPIAVYAQWVEETLISALSYTVDNQGITINGLKTELTSLIIPAYIGGVPVLKIAPNAFAGRAQLTVLRLPDTLTEIGAGALRGCMELTELTIPENVTGIGNGAFEGLKKLTKINFNAINITSANTTADMFSGAGSESSGITVVFGAKVKAVPVNLFAHDGAAGKSSPNIKTVTFAEGSVCTDINGYAFKNCTTLQSITLPPSLKAIYTYAFSNTSLSSVELPSGVTNIKTYAFAGCTQLSTVTLSENLTTIDANAFNGCIGITTLTIPEKVTSIGAGAFKNCIALTEINIPEKVTAIGEYAFEETKKLTKITYNAANIGSAYTSVDMFSGAGSESSGITVIFGATVQAVPVELFAHDGAEGKSSPNIKTVTFAAESTCKYINGSAFKNCTSLQSITLPPCLETMADYAFYNTSLGSVNFPDSLLRINDYTFAGCSLIETLTIPANVTKIASNAFDGCTALSTLTFAAGSKLETINTNSFANAPIVTATVPALAIQAISKADLESMVILDGTYIASNAFSGAAKLKTVTLPDTLTTINAGAFKDCAALTEINIPEKVTAIGEYAFEGTKKLTKINFNAINMGDSNVSFDMFSGAGSESDGITVIFGANVKRVPMYLFGHDGAEGKSSPNIKTVTFATGSVCTVIIGDAFKNCTSLQSITLPASLEVIYARAFYNTALTSVTLPASVTELKSYVFAKCTQLSSVKLSESLTSIGNNAFDGCTELTSMTIPATVQTINANILKGCTKLQSLTVPFVGMVASPGSNDAQYPLGYLFGTNEYEGATATMQSYMNNGSSTSGTYYIPDSLTSVTVLGGTDIIRGAFQNCKYVTSVTLSEGIKQIQPLSFSGSGITSITLPEGMTAVYSYAFQDCAALKTVTISATVTKFSSDVFKNCEALTDVYYTGTKEQWDEITFGTEYSNPCKYAKHLWIGGVDVLATT